MIGRRRTSCPVYRNIRRAPPTRPATARQRASTTQPPFHRRRLTLVVLHRPVRPATRLTPYHPVLHPPPSAAHALTHALTHTHTTAHTRARGKRITSLLLTSPRDIAAEENKDINTNPDVRRHIMGYPDTTGLAGSLPPQFACRARSR